MRDKLQGLDALAASAGSPLVSTPRGPVVTIQTPAEDHGRSRQFAQPHRLAEKSTASMVAQTGMR